MRRTARRLVWPVAVALVVVLVWAAPAGAQDQLPENPDHIYDVIDVATLWVASVLAGLATLFLTIGGALYILAGGDPGQIEKSKTAVKSALIGYALAAAAPVVFAIVASILRG